MLIRVKMDTFGANFTDSAHAMQVRTIAFYNRPFPCGGAETVTRNLAYFFHARGMRVLIYTSLLQEELLGKEDRKTFETRVLPDPIDEAREKNVEFLQKSLVEEQVDVLIVQCMQNFPFARLRETVRHTRFIFCLHSTPLWEINDWRQRKSYQISNPTFMRRLEFVFLRKPVYRFTDKLKRRYLRLYSSLLSGVDRFVSLCPQYSEQIQSQLLDYARHTGAVIDRDAFSRKIASVANPLLPAEEPTVCPKEKIVLFVGRFTHSDKRIDRLLRIWKHIEQKRSDWRLILVGDGIERESLHRLARRLNLQRIEFAGYRQDVAPFYRRASFICLTSSFEGFGMCLVEAQQYGCIPVAFDSYAAVQEIMQEGKSGILVPPYDLKRYAEALLSVFDDQNRQEQLRRNSYASAKRYELAAIGEKWLQLFAGL